MIGCKYKTSLYDGKKYNGCGNKCNGKMYL